MFKKYFGLALCLCLLVSLTFAESNKVNLATYDEKTFDWHTKGETVDLELTGAEMDQVWTACIKALMKEKFRVVTSDKASGNLTARKSLGFLSTEKEEADPEGIQVLIQKTDDPRVLDLTVNYHVTAGRLDLGLSKRGVQKFFKDMLNVLTGEGK